MCRFAEDMSQQTHCTRGPLEKCQRCPVDYFKIAYGGVRIPGVVSLTCYTVVRTQVSLRQESDLFNEALYSPRITGRRKAVS